MDKAENIQINEVKSLLDKYFDGNTSIVEENALRYFFTSREEIPRELEYARAMFGYFTSAATDTGRPAVHPAGVDKGQVIPVPARRLRNRGLYYYLAGALSTAAVISLIVMLSPAEGLMPAQEETVYCYIDGRPVTDLELAMEYTHRVLGHISEAVTAPMPETSVFGAFDNLQYITGFAEKLDRMNHDDKK